MRWFLLLLAVLEVVAFAWIARRLGVILTLGALVLDVIVGAWLVAHQGLATWQKVTTRLQQGEVPAKALFDAVLILAAGAFLIFPGFVSDAIALLLLLPPTRALLRPIALLILAAIAGWPRGRSGPNVPASRIEIVDDSGRLPPPSASPDDDDGPRGPPH